MTITIMKVLAYLCQIAVFILPIMMVWKNRKPHYHQRQQLYFPTWALYLLGIIMIWLLIQVGVYFTTAYLRAELDVFDLDNNGFFTSEEINEAQRAAMMRVTSDTGRVLAPITGAIYAMIYMSIIMMIAGLFNFFTKDKIVE